MVRNKVRPNQTQVLKDEIEETSPILRDFRLPPQSRQELRCYGLLSSEEW